MTVIRLFADDQKLSVAVAPKIASGDRNSVQIQVSFSGNWSNYEKSAVFYTSWDKTVYEVMLSDNKCLIPHEVLSMNGDLFIGIRGVDTNGGAVKTTTVLKYRIEKGAPMGDASSVEPTPDVYQQILMRLAEINAVTSVNGIVPDENGNVKINVSGSSGGGIDFDVDETLSLKNGILSVNTTNQMEQDNTLPITSAGVYATVGNIEALLKTI